MSPELAIRGTMPTTRGHDLGKSGHCHPHTKKQPIQKNVVFHNSKLHFLISKVFLIYRYFSKYQQHYDWNGSYMILVLCFQYENWDIGRIWIQSWISKAVNKLNFSLKIISCHRDHIEITFQFENYILVQAEFFPQHSVCCIINRRVFSSHHSQVHQKAKTLWVKASAREYHTHQISSWELHW